MRNNTERGENMSTWILIANSSEAHIYSSDNPRIGELKLVKDFTHPESRKKERELISDKGRRQKGEGGVGSDYEKRTNPKKVEAEYFAIELAKELKSNFGINKYENIVIIAPAHFYALIKQHLNTGIPELLYVAKDYTKYKIKDLNKVVRELAFPEK